MSRGRTMSRRRFLLLSAGFGASCVTGLAPLPASADPRAAVPPADRLLGLVRGRSSARVVGAAYLALVPSEADGDRLVEAIVGGLEGGEGALRCGREKLRGRLARRVAGDFAQGATIELRGWIVSRTEARLCALAALDEI